MYSLSFYKGPEATAQPVVMSTPSIHTVAPQNFPTKRKHVFLEKWLNLDLGHKIPILPLKTRISMAWKHGFCHGSC